MSLLPQYTHIINPKLKHIYLSFDDAGTLIVKSPKVPLKRIEQLLIKKSSWIRKSQQNIESKKGKRVDFSESSTLFYMGDPYPLRLIRHEKKRSKLSFDEEGFCLYYHTYDELGFQRHLDAFYKEKAKAYLPEHIDVWSKRMYLSYNKLTFRKTKRQWGSCSAQNNLSFNTMIMKLPKSVIQYIIVHELSHIRHKHHQKPFWDHVACYLPDYKSQVKELKNYTT